MKIDKGMGDTIELATAQYNKSIHWVVIVAHPDEPQEEMYNNIQKAQTALRARENASRKNRVFEVGEKVLVKTNRRLGNKLTPLCEERAVEADMGTTVFIKGRVVHKDNLN